ncbi:DUF6461 domain-containing protein [Nonomuraea sp. NPDC050556]|uniref:DUF6461 domain-containing protein n=1 Tax=Nonomuraea sp. NPDC050556 TaxID=3364369 RepID=UPI0037ACDFF4
MLRRAGNAPCAVYAARGGSVLETEWPPAFNGPLSVGTAMATVFFDVKHDDFTYAVDGRLVSAFSVFAYSCREGVEPDPLEAAVLELGLDRDERVEEPVAAALELAGRATGVYLSAADFVRPSGQVAVEADSG